MLCVWRRIWFSSILWAGLLMAAWNVFAGETPNQAVVNLVGTMQRVLKLTDAQVRQVTSAVKVYVWQVEELKADGVTGTALQRKMNFLRDDMNSELSNYLTGEQMTVLQAQMTSSSESGNRGAVSGKRAALSGTKSSIAAVTAPAQDKDGVLESAGPGRIKSGVVW